MLSLATAVRFDRPASVGKTKPCFVACALEDGSEVELVLKFTAGCEMKERSLVAEAIAALLAADLDLPVPEPFVVAVEPDFIAALSDASVRSQARKSPRLNFGSKKLPAGFATYPTDKPLSRTLVSTAAEIFAFDHFIANPDRTVSNPNLLFNGREFAIFDHELAFFTEGILGWRPPWEPGGAQFPQNMPPQIRHVFLEELRGRKIEFDRLSGAFDGITNSRLAEYREALPDEWTQDPASVDGILGYIRELKERLPLAINQLLEALA